MLSCSIHAEHKAIGRRVPLAQIVPANYPCEATRYRPAPYVFMIYFTRPVDGKRLPLCGNFLSERSRPSVPQKTVAAWQHKIWKERPGRGSSPFG